MKVKEIVERVRLAIDEQMENDSEFLNKSTDEANLTAVIIDKIRYALIYVIENAPDEKLDSNMLTEVNVGDATVTVAAGKCVSVKLPQDVLRVMSARLSSWSLSPVPITEYSQEYLMQQDEYARGSWDRPVTAIVYKGTDRYLELYSAKTSEDTVSVSCIKTPSVADAATMQENPDTDVSIPARLESAVIYQIAGLTMVAFREDIASSLFTIAQRYMQTNQSQDAA